MLITTVWEGHKGLKGAWVKNKGHGMRFIKCDKDTTMKC